jgi:hypothetical protein
MSIRASPLKLSAHHNQLLWFCSNGQPVEMSQIAHGNAVGKPFFKKQAPEARHCLLVRVFCAAPLVLGEF